MQGAGLRATTSAGSETSRATLIRVTFPPSIQSILDRAEWRFFPRKPSPKQIALLLSPAFETFYGGAAAGGKTDGLLMRALLYVDVPGYHAIIFRKTEKELRHSTGVIARSKAWLFGRGPGWSETDLRWTFPSGATLSFGSVQRNDDVFGYQGPEWQFAGFDELTAWTEWSYRYLIGSRVRATHGVAAPVGVAATSNPGGRGHEWVRARFIDPSTREPDVAVIRAAIADNPGIRRAEYEASLSHLPPVLRAQLMDGNWDVVEQGTLIGREDLPLVEAAPAGPFPRVRYWDCAATKGAGCFTVGGLLSKNFEGLVTVEHVVRGQWDAGEVDQVILQTAKADGRAVAVDWEEEPGSSGKLVSASRRRLLAGFRTYGTPSTGSKWIRAQPFASYARAKNVRVVNGPWTRAYLDEVTTATEDLEGEMDQVDMSSGAFRWLSEHARFGPGQHVPVPVPRLDERDLPPPRRESDPWAGARPNRPVGW